MSISLPNHRHTTAVIHLDHLSHNYHLLKGAIDPDLFFCPMIKANGYGHGDVEIALRLQKEGVQTMGVGLIEEGLLLRENGVNSELLVFGIFDQAGAREIIKWNFTPVLSLWEQIDTLEQLAEKPVSVHLKFDTGMHRLGFVWGDAQKLFERLNRSSKIKVKGICTHLHTAEDMVSLGGKSEEQLERFGEVERIFAPLRPISHSLNSAGLMSFIHLQKQNAEKGIHVTLNQGVRPGLALYGYSPLPPAQSHLDLKPVMSLRSQVVRYHTLQKGEGASYNHTWKAKRLTILAVILIGYVDGYHRLLSNKAEVLFDGVRVPLVGNVCMDYVMADVTDVVQKKSLSPYQNQEVTLFGYDSKGNLLPASELAQKSQTITWEILTSIGERVPRSIQAEKSKVESQKKEVSQ